MDEANEAYEERLEAIREERRQEEAALRRDAERYRWLRGFLEIDDVGDEEMVYALVVDNEGIEDAASRARCWSAADFHNDNPTVDDAIDAAMQGANV